MRNKKLLFYLLICLLLIMAFIIYLSDNPNYTGNIINWIFIDNSLMEDYTNLFNDTLVEFNQCIIKCPEIPFAKNFIAEDCILRCDEIRNNSMNIGLMELTANYSEEEIDHYINSDKAVSLELKLNTFSECFNSCGYIFLNQPCVNECLPII